MRGPEARAQGHGPDQRRDHGALCAHREAGRARGGHAGGEGPQARRGRPAADHDVRGAEQRHPGRTVPGAFRRHVDRLQRPDAAHTRPGPRLRPGAAGRRLRRARPSRQGPDLARHPRLPCHRQVHRHLRPGPQRPSGLRRLAGRGGHRVDLAEPGHRHRHLAAPGGQVNRKLAPRARVLRRGARAFCCDHPRCVRPPPAPPLHPLRAELHRDGHRPRCGRAPRVAEGLDRLHLPGCDGGGVRRHRHPVPHHRSGRVLRGRPPRAGALQRHGRRGGLDERRQLHRTGGHAVRQRLCGPGLCAGLDRRLLPRGPGHRALPAPLRAVHVGRLPR
mmetsp:Transcript_53285/g.125038  ORF Transcript_53285/g.125038 Transcript_53285/m.125038 type:complete len:332 (+) Transcript_53285:2349-3344(+)